jgi:hypothetical protein
MEKTRLEDLFVINYRSQGLAEKICKTHQIVLAKRIKLGVRSVKVPWVDLDLKNLIVPGVFEERCKTQTIAYEIRDCSGAYLQDCHFISYLWFRTEDRSRRVGNTVAGGIRGSGGLGTRLVCAGGRGDQGEFVGMLTGDGDAGTRPESGVDGVGGRIRGGRILRRRRGSGGLQARMSHEKGRGGHDGRVERLIGGGATRER